MNYYPNELEKHYKIEIPLAEYERMKDRITQFEIFKKNECYFKESYDGYRYAKYYALSKDKLLKELNEEIELHSKETDKYMIERNQYAEQLRKIKKSIFYKIFKIFIKL